MISSSGSESRPSSRRSLTSAGSTASTAEGNCAATVSQFAYTAPSASCDTTRACGTSSVPGSARCAPTWSSGTRNAPGGSWASTRSNGMRTCSPSNVGAGTAIAGDSMTGSRTTSTARAGRGAGGASVSSSFAGGSTTVGAGGDGTGASSYATAASTGAEITLCLRSAETWAADGTSILAGSTWPTGSATGEAAGGGGAGALPSSGLNGAGKLSIPGTSAGPRPSKAPNTSGASCRTISSRGRSSRPLTIRSFTSASGTASTAAGNCSATSSHATCTTPSPSCGTIRECATSSVSGSRNRAPSWGSGTRNAPGGSCPTTRSNGMRTAVAAAGLGSSGAAGGAGSTIFAPANVSSLGGSGAGGGPVFRAFAHAGASAVSSEAGSSGTMVTGGFGSSTWAFGGATREPSSSRTASRKSSGDATSVMCCTGSTADPFLPASGATGTAGSRSTDAVPGGSSTSCTMAVAGGGPADRAAAAVGGTAGSFVEAVRAQLSRVVPGRVERSSLSLRAPASPLGRSAGVRGTAARGASEPRNGSVARSAPTISSTTAGGKAQKAGASISGIDETLTCA